MVAALTAVTVSAVAQSEPASVSPASVSSINAHRVDGKHAVGAGASRANRAGKLVATNAQGYLPSNILNPRPLSGVTLETVFETEVATDDSEFINADCPEGARVTGGGFNFSNLGDGAPTYQLIRSNPEGEGWEVGVRKIAPDPATGPPTVRAWAVCLTTTPPG